MSFSINIDSIMDKVKGWSTSAEGQKAMRDKLLEYRKSGVSKTAGGGKIVDAKEARRIADAFILKLKMTARKYAKMNAAGEDDGMPSSVLAHFDSLTVDNIRLLGDGSFSVSISFADDLSRPSLDNDLGYDGVRNIVAVFNNGVNASGSVFGWWDGHTPTGEAIYRSGNSGSAWVRSRSNRPGLHFIQEAASSFEKTWGTEYGLTIIPADIYQE